METNRETRELKVYGQSGYKYQDTSTIVLKGKWLENAGFKIGSKVKVAVMPNELILTLEKWLFLSAVWDLFYYIVDGFHAALIVSRNIT